MIRRFAALPSILCLTLSLLTLSAPALADSVRIGNHLVRSGDSEARLLRIVGEPDRIVTLENRRGGAVGQRWTWFDVPDPNNDRSLVVRMRDGRVVSLRSEVHR